MRVCNPIRSATTSLHNHLVLAPQLGEPDLHPDLEPRDPWEPPFCSFHQYRSRHGEKLRPCEENPTQGTGKSWADGEYRSLCRSNLTRGLNPEIQIIPIGIGILD